VNGLERSLQHAAEIHLGARNMPELVKLSYSQSTAEPGETLSIREAFEQAGHQLLIVGPPGSGKTTQALTLMRDLLATARCDEQAPVPEIFPLSSWAKQRKPILEWLADEIRTRHGRPLSQARFLVWSHQVLPILDGLDEVAPKHRAECIDAINCFWEGRGGAPMILCCRQAEYQALPEQVKLGGAVSVCPPDSGEVDHYLEAAGAQWEGVRARLRDRTESSLRELLSTPLMLSVAVLAYRDANPMELCDLERPDVPRERLWSRYITTVTSRDYSPTGVAAEGEPRYSEPQVRRWLGWLAKEMASRNETEFWLHEWSGPPPWRKGVKVTLGLVVALPFALAYGLAFGYGQRLGLAYGLSAGLTVALGIGIAIVLTFGLNVGPASTGGKPFDRRALALGLATGLAVALIVGLMSRLPSRLPMSGVPLSKLPRLSKSLLADLAYGVTFGLLGGLNFGLNVGPASTGRKPFDRRALALGLATGLAVALVVKLMNGLAIRLAVESTYGLAYGLAFLVNSGPIPAYRKPFDRSALAAGLALGIAVGMAVGMAVGTSQGWGHGLMLGLAGAPAFALVGVLAFGLLGVGPERERVVVASPRQAIRTSGWLGLVLGLLVAVVVGVAMWMVAGRSEAPAGGLVFGLTFGLALGVAAGLAAGLDALAFHYAFRLWLRTHRLGPWDWPGFLDWAGDRMLLKTNGASYQWIHLELRDHLA
jgi:DNA polymerase III delta prime subunit